ncbi:branched-chain amino acid ABC transporter substrate-binding protein [Beijerinckia sp. L45]|uniref:branched-chain amino acid ABC transporter substrate-binding protein n=1 Tax=Beijerinckia sp. L45 TaxID=1641855 RepID=UPI001FEDB3EC|nr:branched-chain amino acid ABC transporter substrate-binding protein [Beijerinckia sp. L45]
MVFSAPALADVRIGIAAPLSGSDAVFGTQIRLGVEQAIADINADGGFLGQRGSAVPGDDLGDPKRGSEIAAGFVRDKVQLVVGPFSSGVAMPASAIYGAAGVLAITPSATAPQITERGLATIFRLGGRDDQQSAVAARYLADHATKIAILHDRTTAGKALADAVRKALLADGVKDALYASIDKGDKDVGPLVNRLKTSGAQIAFWGGTQTEAGLLVRQLHDAGSHAVLMGGIGIASDEFATLAGPGAEGTLMTFPADPRQRPDAADLLHRLQAKGTEPDAYTFYAYAAVQIIQQAAGLAKSLDPSALAATMHGGTVFKTVLGDVAFDMKGDVTTPGYGVIPWRKGPTGRIGF